jgi:hypothetical protein
MAGPDGGLLTAVEEDPSGKVDDRYRWVALANTNEK